MTPIDPADRIAAIRARNNAACANRRTHGWHNHEGDSSHEGDDCPECVEYVVGSCLLAEIDRLQAEVLRLQADNRRLSALAALGEAWAEVEAECDRLDARWGIDHGWRDSGAPFSAFAEGLTNYQAIAWAEGPTPVAALLALRDRLLARSGEGERSDG